MQHLSRIPRLRRRHLATARILVLSTELDASAAVSMQTRRPPGSRLHPRPTVGVPHTHMADLVSRTVCTVVAPQYTFASFLCRLFPSQRHKLPILSLI